MAGVAPLLGLVIAASSYHFHPRPHLATIALTAWTLGWLGDIEAGCRSPKWLLVLPPVMAVWTNVHGGALAGIASTILVLTVWALSSVCRTVKASTGRSGCSVPLCALVAATSGLALFVNPYGTEMLRVWLALSTSKVLPHVISEHGPVAIASVEGLSLVSLGLVYLVILIGCPRRSIRTTWLIPLIWLPLAFLRVRHGPLFAVTAATAIADMWPISRTTQRLARVAPAIVDAAITRRASRAAMAMCGGLVAASIMLQSMGLRIPLIGAGWATLNTDYWPVEATDAARGFINKHPSQNRIFNDMLFGGYLISDLPQAKVYIDDRCELYGDDSCCLCGRAPHHRISTRKPRPAKLTGNGTTESRIGPIFQQAMPGTHSTKTPWRPFSLGGRALLTSPIHSPVFLAAKRTRTARNNR
jgi:hypothetical protein